MTSISINILTKNRCVSLNSALESVLHQTFKDYEIIIIDDGSTDESATVLERWRQKFSKFQVITHPVSVGIVASRREALAASSSPYIALLDDDDEWSEPTKLALQFAHMQEHPTTVLVGGGIEEVGSNGALRVVKRVETDAEIRRSMLFRNNFFTSTAMFRREVALKAGGFRTLGPDLAEDYDLWLRLGNLGQMYNFPRVFARYRRNNYDPEKFIKFLEKQLTLIVEHSANYPYYTLASLFLRSRVYLNIFLRKLGVHV